MTEYKDKEFITLKLRALNPVHIGGGKPFEASDYIWMKQEKKLYVLDPSKWIQYLGAHNLIGRFASYTDTFFKRQRDRSKSGTTNMSSFMSNWITEARIPTKDLAQFTAYQFDLSKDFDDDAINSMKTCIKTVEMMPYIPGSSLKGAIRHAILVDYIQKNKSRLRPKWDRLERGLYQQGRPKLDNRTINSITQEIESEFLIRPELWNQKRSDSTYDLLKGLVVSDSQPLKQSALFPYKIEDYVLSRGEVLVNPMPLTLECIRPGSETQVQLGLDYYLLKHIGIDSFEALLSAIKATTKLTRDIRKHFSTNDFDSEDLLSAEKDPAGTNGIFIGASTGFVSKTLIYALAPGYDEARALTSKILDAQFNKHKHLQLDHAVSPRTIHTFAVDQYSDAPGYCALERMTHA